MPLTMLERIAEERARGLSGMLLRNSMCAGALGTHKTTFRFPSPPSNFSHSFIGVDGGARRPTRCLNGQSGRLAAFQSRVPESLAKRRKSGNGVYSCCCVRIGQSRNMRWCPIRVDDSTVASILIYEINLFLEGVLFVRA